MDELKLCERGALELGQSFSGTRVSIFPVEVGQAKQRPNSDNSRQIPEKRTLIACKDIYTLQNCAGFLSPLFFIWSKYRFLVANK